MLYDSRSHSDSSICSSVFERILCLVETFTKPRPLVEDGGFDSRRRRSLDDLERVLASGSIDAPIVSLVDRIRSIPYCYTLQSCSGHFTDSDGADHHSVRGFPPSSDERATVRYRIAYLAFCIQNNANGMRFLEDMKDVSATNPSLVQFGSADWFWRSCPNSYVLQVEPVRFANEDSAEVGLAEAIRIEAERDRFFALMDEVVERHVTRC